MLLVRNASMEHAGRYLCHARTHVSNVTRTVGWKVHLRAPSLCPLAYGCHERDDVICHPCTCPPKKQFYGRNRIFRCYNEQNIVDVKLLTTSHNFRQFEPLVVDYELTTFGDTQVRWIVNGYIRQSYTVLLNTEETIVTLQKRLIIGDKVERDERYEGTIEARVRGTELIASRTATIVLSYIQPGSPCEPNESKLRCSVINGECVGKVCACPQDWVENHMQHTCKRPCSDPTECMDLGRATCNSRDCECLPGFYLQGGKCTRLECVSHSECSKRHSSSFCHRGYCYCLAGYTLSNGRCEPQHCLVADECPQPDMHCVRGLCVCNSQFDLVENTCRKSDVGACDPASQSACATPNSICDAEDNQCRCKKGYRAVTVLGGRDCLDVDCTNGTCNVTNARCVNGMCLCPNGKPPTSAFCFGHIGVTAAELMGSVKLASLSAAILVGVIIFACVTMTCMKSKEDYVSSIEDDKPVDDEGAIVAAKKAKAFLEEEEQPVEPLPEEGFVRTFMRSMFPKLSDGLFGVHGEETRIKFGSTDISSSLDI
ncbi:uncharacterized protein LOC135397670 isoform X2 [Ornithodoros turicata]